MRFVTWWQAFTALFQKESQDKARLDTLETRMDTLEAKLMALTDDLEQYDADVQALINKDTLDVADRDAAKAALSDQTAKLNGGEIVSAEEAAKVRVTMAALHKFLNPAPADVTAHTPGETGA